MAPPFSRASGCVWEEEGGTVVKHLTHGASVFVWETD